MVPFLESMGMICLSGESVMVRGIPWNQALDGKTPYVLRRGFIVMCFKAGRLWNWLIDFKASLGMARMIFFPFMEFCPLKCRVLLSEMPEAIDTRRWL